MGQLPRQRALRSIWTDARAIDCAMTLPYHLRDMEIDSKTRTLLLPDLGVRVEERHWFLLRCHGLMKALQCFSGAKFRIDDIGSVFVEVLELSLNVTTSADLHILYELLVQQVYNFGSARPFVVIDVGMNVGFASLYFARREQVLHVHGFEPFAPTFAQAMVNFGLNRGIASKITAHQCGLGGVERTLEVEYAASHRELLGVDGIPAYARPLVLDAERSLQPISIRSASSTLQPILAVTPDPVVLKIDCEGAEYEIFADLAASGLLSKLSGVMCEWHHQGAAPLLDLMHSVGFATTAVAFDAQPVGMIYGFKSP